MYMTKSHEKSFFTRFHSNSPLAEQVLSDEPIHNNKHCEVLQIISMDSNQFDLLVELLYIYI